tara:strand:+ start:25376 stop:27196 length:1821 start_codon:yes stop_codon:yes gene_type:complete
MADLSTPTHDGQSEQTAQSLITQHIDIWTTAIEQKSSAGRGTSNKFSLYGIKKLRELILELAVRGKLVPQDVNDEPASVLLERIAAEKKQLVKEGKLKKQKPLPEIGEDEKPFELPQGWAWSYIQQIGHDWGQKTPDSEFSYIDVGSINKELGFIEEPSLVDPKDAPSRARKIVKKGTVIYSTVRPYLLNIAVIDKDFSPEPIASTAFAIIHPFDGISATYIYRYFRSPTFITYVESVQNGIAYPAINDKQFFTGLIAIPPMEEQNRIVAKVDELMSLCDALEAQTEASISAHQTLVETLLKSLIADTSGKTAMDGGNVENAGAIFDRVAEHFDTLFTTAASIDTLKQTILQLAVMGKLVPQASFDEGNSPNYEPASVLLARIAVERLRLINEEKLRTNANENFSEKDLYLISPDSWGHCRLGNLAKFIDYRGKTPNKLDAGIRLITAKNVKFGFISLEPEEFISEEEYEIWMTRGLPRVGDILFTPEAPLGNVAIVNISEKFALAQRAICFQMHEPAIAEFMKIVIMSQAFQKQLIENATGMTATGIKASKLKEILMPIPPLEEQYRIVTKVDELMTLCDQLKARLSDAQTTQLHLTDAIVEQAL